NRLERDSRAAAKDAAVETLDGIVEAFIRCEFACIVASDQAIALEHGAAVGCVEAVEHGADRDRWSDREGSLEVQVEHEHVREPIGCHLPDLEERLGICGV